MRAALYPPARPQSIGEVLDSAFRIFSASLLRCLPYGVLAIVAGQLPNIYLIATARPLRQFGGGDPLWWGLYVLGALLAIAFVNVIVLRQRAISSSQPLQGTVAGGLRKALATLAVVLILLLAVGVWFVPLLAIPGEYRRWGLVVLSLPATYVGVVLSCSVLALLVGGKGILASLRYSAHLIRGCWWRTATVYSVAIIMLAVYYTLIGVIAALLVPFAGVTDVAVFTAVSAVMAAALGAVGTPFYTAIGLALYGDLEVRKEGTDLERRIAGAAAG